MSWIFSHSKNTAQAHHAGFGLVELMVSIGIMLLVTTIILTRHTAFNGTVLLRSQAYEIALQLREIQLSAVSSQSVNGDYRARLGVYFNSTATLNRTYRTFNDADQNGYEASEEFGQQGFLDSRFEIREIRRNNGSVITEGVSIVFQRPNFDAKFYGTAGEIPASSIILEVARVGQTGDTPDVMRTIEITATGQIAVQ